LLLLAHGGGLRVTLVQVLADETSLHMACDFCLSDPRTKRVIRNDAFKLVTVARSSGWALIGVTGNGYLEGKPIGQWITEAVGWLDGPGSIDDVVDDLASKAETPLSRITDAVQRCHTFVVGAMIGTQARVSLVSNFEFFDEGKIQRIEEADTELTVTSLKPKSAQHFATGVQNAVTASEREQLELMLKSKAPERSIQKRLSEVNAEVSRRTATPRGRIVSEGCYAASLYAIGRGSSHPFLTDEQKGDVIPPELEDHLARAGLRLKPKLGPDGKPLPIRVRQSGFGTEGVSPEYFQEQFKLRPRDAQLRDRHGSILVSQGKLDEAMDAFELAKTLDPSYAPAIAHLAQQFWLHKGDTAEADRLFTEAIDIAESPVPAWILSDFAVFCDEGLGETQRARELHDRAVEAENYPLAKARLGYFLMRHGDEIERADELFSEALEPPDNPDILYLAGKADWFYKGDRQAGRTKLQKACTLSPTHVPTLRLTAYVCLALEDGGSAAYYYRKVIGRGQRDSQVHANYGLALLMNHRFEGALRHLSKAHRSRSDDLGIAVNLAATLWVLRKGTEAVALLREILSQSPPPEIEVEILAMLRLAAPPAAKEMVRLRELIASGHRGDGITLRTMVRYKSGIERNLGFQLSDIIEGKAAVPPTL
jgi:Tfp pilus assembly protein PilF